MPPQAQPYPNQPQPTGQQPGVSYASPAPTQLPPTPTPIAQQSGKKSSNPAQPRVNPNSTQNALLISEIRDNMVITNDGSMRAVVTCRSINFDLMSAREREGVEYSYQQFLNSLYFPIQIFIRSQKVDIGPYMDRLDKIRRDQDNMLLSVLMDDYIDFISNLAQETNIMEKSFYIAIPYYPAGDMSSAVNSSKNFMSNLFSPQKQQHIRIDEKTFIKAKDEIRNRVSTVVNGLMQMGIRAIQLDTRQLGELYYNAYNPDTAVREPLGNFENLSAPIVTKGKGEAPQPQFEREEP
jgi:hypothetical protein